MLHFSKRTKKDTGWLKVINPFKKSLRSSSPRTRFYVSREDLDGGSIEFEEEDEVDVSSRSRVVRGMCGADLNIFRLHVPSMYNNATMKKLKNSVNILNKFPNFFFNILYL